MIEGHGDDLYRYNNIKMNFSSNIYNGTDLSALEAYLCTRLDVVRSYPEPSAASLERMIARECGIGLDFSEKPESELLVELLEKNVEWQRLLEL